MENLNNMNEFNSIKPRVRNQTLIIVEGNHEKNTLFYLLLKCFPEMKIEMENVWIYGTNIYRLNDDIVKEYEECWYEEDIDLPFVISKKENRNPLCYKTNFTNIILIFDYERQDTYFSEEKIVKMQEYFSDATDVGRLYINYPMIESYQHLESLPDPTYEQRWIPANFERGSWYKNQVREKIVTEYVDFPKKISKLLMDNFKVTEEEKCKECVKALLDISEKEALENRIELILQNNMQESELKTAKHRMAYLINKIGYASKNMSYWQHIRTMFQEIIRHNICKAYKLQEGSYEIADPKYRECFNELDFIKILLYQNKESREISSGRIWVLNTSVLFVAEFNFALLEKI